MVLSQHESALSCSVRLRLRLLLSLLPTVGRGIASRVARACSHTQDRSI